MVPIVLGKWALALMVLFIFSLPPFEAGQAQQPPTDSDMADRLETLNRYRNLLQSEDPFVRLAAFEEAIASGDSVIRAMALEIAFGLDDARLHTSAVRHVLTTRSKLTFNAILPEEPSEAHVFLHRQFNGIVLEEVLVNDDDTLSFRPPRMEWDSAQMVRGGIQFSISTHGGSSADRCLIVLRPAAPLRLLGAAECTMYVPDARRAERFPERVDWEPVTSLLIEIPLS